MLSLRESGRLSTVTPPLLANTHVAVSVSISDSLSLPPYVYSNTNTIHGDKGGPAQSCLRSKHSVVSGKERERRNGRGGGEIFPHLWEHRKASSPHLLPSQPPPSTNTQRTCVDTFGSFSLFENVIQLTTFRSERTKK